MVSAAPHTPERDAHARKRSADGPALRQHTDDGQLDRTGRDRLADRVRLAEQLLGFAHQAITEQTRAPRIGPELEVAAAAGATDRLVAYLGRTP